MVCTALLALMLALLAATSGDYLQDNGVWLNKCCGVFERLSSDGDSCVEAPWPRNFSVRWEKDGSLFPPLDSEWVRRWLPPGIPLQKISKVVSGSRLKFGIVSSVNASAFWNPTLNQGKHHWKNTITFLVKFLVARPRPGKGFRRARYCVDAAPPPLGPFVMRVDTLCSGEECVVKCCPKGEHLKKNNSEGHWNCKKDSKGFMASKKTFLTEVLDPEFPVAHVRRFCGDLRLSPTEDGYVLRALSASGALHFVFSSWSTCFDFHRSSNGRLEAGLFYCDHPRVARGVYWLLRPLCVLSALLLLASLISIACDKSMRRKVHGRCLASHAACLLGFNIGQIGYFMTISDQMDQEKKEFIPPNLQIACKNIALTIYFLLIAAWFWLTALCLNMAMGFRLQETRPKKESWKRFLTLSAFAWGLPGLLTITCSILFVHQFWTRDGVHWYTPTLAESRVCFNEHIIPVSSKRGLYKTTTFVLLKSGTALFYFGPVACLVICNIICIARTLRKVQFLKRGNSVLRREEDQIPLGQRHPEGNNFPSSHTATGNGNRSGSTVDTKTIKLYIKMIVMSGGIELLTEVIMWFTTVYQYDDWYTEEDLGLAYRAAGYVTDFFRAAVVTWLAAPEGGYLGLVRRLRRGKGDKK